MAANLVLNLSQPVKSREHVPLYQTLKQPPNTGAGLAEGRSKQGFLTKRDMVGTATGAGNKTQRRAASERDSKDFTIPRDSLIQDIDPSRFCFSRGVKSPKPEGLLGLEKSFSYSWLVGAAGVRVSALPGH